MDDFKLDILKTIYDGVECIANNLYAVKTGNKYGLVAGDIVIDAKYDKAIYRDKYSIFKSGEYSYLFVNCLHSNKTQAELIPIIWDSVVEHSAIDFRILEFAKESNVNERILYDTVTGKELIHSNMKNAVSYNPYNNKIIFAVEEDKQFYGIDDTYKAGLVSDLLSSIYDNVTYSNRRYKVTDRETKAIIDLNRYGQVY